MDWKTLHYKDEDGNRNVKYIAFISPAPIELYVTIDRVDDSRYIIGVNDTCNKNNSFTGTLEEAKNHALNVVLLNVIQLIKNITEAIKCGG